MIAVQFLLVAVFLGIVAYAGCAFIDDHLWNNGVCRQTGKDWVFLEDVSTKTAFYYESVDGEKRYSIMLSKFRDKYDDRW